MHAAQLTAQQIAWVPLSPFQYEGPSSRSWKTSQQRTSCVTVSDLVTGLRLGTWKAQSMAWSLVCGPEPKKDPNALGQVTNRLNTFWLPKQG